MLNWQTILSSPKIVADVHIEKVVSLIKIHLRKLVDFFVVKKDNRLAIAFLFGLDRLRLFVLKWLQQCHPLKALRGRPVASIQSFVP